MDAASVAEDRAGTTASPRPELIGLGMSILDLVQIVDEFPSHGGVSQVQQSVLMGGGPVPTALCAAARLGIHAAILDRVGDDWRGHLLRTEYERFGVVTRYLLHAADRCSPFGTVLVRKRDGERHLLYEEGDFRSLRIDELPIEWLKACRYLHLNGRHWPTCLEAAQIVRAHGGQVSFDGGAHRFEEKHHELLPLVDVLIVAADYADHAVGVHDRLTQVQKLSQWGASLVGITDGARGSWHLHRESTPFHQPAFPLTHLVDTTGCGDVFHGAFLAGLLRGASISDCARSAAAVAAISATALGGRGNLPTNEELTDWLRPFT